MKTILLIVLVSVFCIHVYGQDTSSAASAVAANDNPKVEGANPGGKPAEPPVPQTHPQAITYSDAYRMRAKIHRYASFATLPLFATQIGVGQSLFNSSTESDTKKSLHAAAGAGVVGLFGVNTVTGVWNLWESRHDPEKHKLKLAHGILMLASDVGFVATIAITPERERRGFAGPASLENNASTHRNLAIGSIAVATAGYLLMLFGNR